MSASDQQTGTDQTGLHAADRVQAASVFGPVESDNGFQSAVRRVQRHRPRLVSDDAVDIDLPPFLKAFDRCLGLGPEVSVGLTG